MNIENKVTFSKQALQPEVLQHACETFADTLTSGRWGQRAVRFAQMQRTVGEAIGNVRRHPMSIDAETMATVGFEARKCPDDCGNREYMVSHFASYSVPGTEIEPMTLSAIKKRHNGKKGSSSNLLRGIKQEELLAEEFDRVQELRYVINSSGVIRFHSLSHDYVFDETSVFYEEYTSGNEYPDLTKDGFPTEEHGRLDEPPHCNEGLSRAAIRRYSRTFDRDYEMQLNFTQLEQEFEFGGQSQQEHTRRALTIVALTASGLLTKAQLTGLNPIR